MRVEADAILTKSISANVPQAEFARSMRALCDLTLVIGTSDSKSVADVVFVSQIDAKDAVAAIKRKNAKRIAIVASDCNSAPKLSFRNAEDGIISATKDNVLDTRAAITRLVFECGITEVVTMLQTKQEGAICVGAAAAGIPLTIFLPFLPERTFAWERLKDLAWTIPRTIVKRCSAIPAIAAAPNFPPVADDPVAAISSSVTTPANAANPVKVAASIPKESVSALPSPVIPSQVETIIVPQPPSPASHPGRRATDVPRVASFKQGPMREKGQVPVVVGKYLAIDAEHPLHDCWILPITIDGRLYQSVLHFMAGAKAEFFGDPLDGLEVASVEQCIRYLLPDDRHDFAAKRAWGQARLAAFERATEAKVGQSKQAREALIATGSHVLVYMSRDRKIGIGYDSFAQGEGIISDKINWKGANGAGTVLERMRAVIGGYSASTVPPREALRREVSPAVSMLRKLSPVVMQREPTREQLDDDEDFTAEDLARLSGDIPVRISRF